MTYPGFTSGFNYDPGKIRITDLKYGSPIGGMTNNSSDSFSLEGLSPEDKRVYLMFSALAPKPVDLGMITNAMKTQAEIAEGVATRKYNQEFMGQGIGALAGGLKTLFGGGSPEMVAYLSQTPERGAVAYQEGYASAGPRQNALPRSYVSRVRNTPYFNT